MLKEIEKQLQGDEKEMTLLVPFDKFHVINELRTKGKIQSEEYTDTGCCVSVRMKVEHAGQIMARYGEMIQ